MLAAIVLLCALAQRSLRMVALNLLAIVLSATLFLWLLRLTGTSLSPLSLISLPLLVGLVVDYSLHVLMALKNQRGDLVKTYDHLAAPILLTGISACIGFGAPALTGQPALQNFGLVMDFGIIAAVVACLGLLPVFFPRRISSDYRARGFYQSARESLADVDRGSMATSELMATVYWRLLRKLESRRFNVFDGPAVRLSKPQKLLLVLRAKVRGALGVFSSSYGAGESSA